MNQTVAKSTGSQPWFKVQPDPRARVRLFCFPYAGGGSSIFRNWSSEFLYPIELVPALLPAREGRIREPGYTQLDKMVEKLALEIAPYLDKPFAFFGHSMGAVIGFELARRLRDERGIEPEHLFVSGRRSPQIPRHDIYIHDLPEAEFVAEVERLNGTPSEVLEHKELMALLIPMLRADFAVCHSYNYEPGEPLRCPITVLGGTHDEEATRDELDGWCNETTGKCNVQMFEGDHFFINQPQVANKIPRLISLALRLADPR